MDNRRARALARLRAATAALALSAAVAACAPDPAQPQLQEVAVMCVSRAEMVRVDDAYCPDWEDYDDDDGYFPYFVPVGVTAFAVGYKVSGGHFTKPAGAKLYYAPPKGGKVHAVPGGPKPVPPKAPPVVKPPAVPPAPPKPPVVKPAAPAPGGGGRRGFR